MSESTPMYQVRISLVRIKNGYRDTTLSRPVGALFSEDEGTDHYLRLHAIAREYMTDEVDPSE